jgi:hypothetical protein
MKSRRLLIILGGGLVSLCLCVAVIYLVGGGGTKVSPTVAGQQASATTATTTVSREANAATGPTETARPTRTPRPTSTPEPTDTPTASAEERARQLVAATLGKGNRKLPRLTSLAYSADEISVQWALDDNLTTEMILRGAWLDVLHMAKVLWQAGYTTQSYVFDGSFSMTDAYGASSENRVILVTLNPETTGKIVWDTFITDNLPVIADTYWQHPAFTK